ncbi:MAG: M23 family metallopeptidase [Actinomycetota bacterium]
MKRYPILSIAFACFLILCMPAVWAEGVFTWPVQGELIKEFSVGEHRGIDIAANAGDSIVAAQDGVVHWIGKTPRGEPYISIDHQNGLTTTYLPVKASVSKGQSISAGAVIGTLSSEIDKSSDEPHLHFGLYETSTRDDKNYLDPCDYLLTRTSAQGNEANDTLAEAPVTQSSSLSSGLSTEDIPNGQVALDQPAEAKAVLDQPTEPAPVESPIKTTVEEAMEQAKSAMNNEVLKPIDGLPLRSNDNQAEKAIEPTSLASQSIAFHQPGMLAVPLGSRMSTSLLSTPSLIAVGADKHKKAPNPNQALSANLLSMGHSSGQQALHKHASLYKDSAEFNVGKVSLQPVAGSSIFNSLQSERKVRVTASHNSTLRAQKILDWEYLPTTVLFFSLFGMSALSVRFARKMLLQSNNVQLMQG